MEVLEVVYNQPLLPLMEILEEIVQLIQVLDKLLQKAEEEILTQEDLVVDHQEELKMHLVMLFKVVKQEFQELMVLVLVVV